MRRNDNDSPRPFSGSTGSVPIGPPPVAAGFATLGRRGRALVFAMGMATGWLTGQLNGQDAPPVVRVERKPAPAVLPLVDADAKPGFAIEPTRVGELALPERGDAEPAPTLGCRPLRLDFPFDVVGFDAPGDGSLWACGKSYKMRFDATGASFVPFFGSQSPQAYPLGFALRAARIGATELALRARARVERVGQSVVLDWGAVREVYHLLPESVEQTFELDALARRGDLVLDVAVRTELGATATTEGFTFANAHGSVSYGQAFVLDAGARKAQITQRLRGTDIELVVPTSFLEQAELPVKIDPVIRVSPLFGTTLERAPDIAYDLSQDMYMVVWEHLANANDADIYGHWVRADGTPVPLGRFFIDLTADYWQLPVVANLRIPHRFLCAAIRGSAPTRQIWGRWTEAYSVNQGPQFEISAGSGSGDKLYPRIGGDPHTIGPTYWLVVWERIFSAADRDVHGRLVQGDGTLGGPGPILIDNTSSTIDTFPNVSRCDGNPSAATQDWNVVFERQVSINDHDIRFARVHWDGSVTTPSTALVGGPVDQRFPSASSVLDDSGGARTWLAVFQEGSQSGDTDVIGVLMRGATPVHQANLSQLEGAAVTQAQRAPSIDSDGCRFAVGYQEQSTSAGLDAYVATFHVDPSQQIALTQGHEVVAATPDHERVPQVCATRSGGGGNQRYGLTWWSAAVDRGAVHVGAYDSYGAGGFTYVNTTCDGFGMNVSGTPSLGNTVVVGVADPGQNQPLLMFGLPIAPVAICGACMLAVDPGSVTVFALPRLTLTIPCETAYLGATLAVQGLSLGSGPCFGGLVRIADTILITVQ